MGERKLGCMAYKMTYDCPECDGEMRCVEQINPQQMPPGLGFVVIASTDPEKRMLPDLQIPVAHKCIDCGYVKGLKKAYPFLYVEPIELEGVQTSDDA